MITHLCDLGKGGTDMGDPLNAEPWQLRLLELNPSYTGWSPGGDCMKGADPKHGWQAAWEIETWKEFTLGLDSHNVCVDFYFAVQRDRVDCKKCEGTGLDDEGSEHVLDDQVDCHACRGRGSIPSEETAHVSLTLWILHPRKGASRGVEIDRIADEHEALEAMTWLRQAAEQNAARWAPLVAELPKAPLLAERFGGRMDPDAEMPTVAPPPPEPEIIDHAAAAVWRAMGLRP